MEQVNSRRSWVVLGAALLAYLAAVTQRTSFGVAGVDATERFDVAAAAVSSIAVAQIVVYAALQIPVGALVDRVGPRMLIVGGAALMATGQLALALAPDLFWAVGARMLVGAGDALTFVSVIRLLPSWFRGRILPQLSQWVGTIGQLGQIVSAVPFAFLLRDAGWTSAFGAAAGLSAVVTVIAAVVIRRGEPIPVTGPVSSAGPVLRLRQAAARPGTQLGFWVHLVAGTPVTAVAILWGHPFLSTGLGYSAGLSAAIMSLLVVGAFVAGPVIGYLIARFPLRRSNLVITVVVLLFAVWTAVLAWPGEPPTALVATFFFVLAMGGPGSLVGFDVARTFNPSSSLGSASGIVNVGGFTGGFVSMLLIGVVLDVLDRSRGGSGVPAELYSLDSFRIAFLVPYAVCGIGMVFLLRARRRTRRNLFVEQGIEIAPLWVALFRRWRRGGRGLGR